jgi:hypothetical protein
VQANLIGVLSQRVGNSDDDRLGDCHPLHSKTAACKVLRVVTLNLLQLLTVL